MTRHILVPMDGSPKSKAGLEHALSNYPDASITILHVMTPYEEWDATDPPLPRDWVDEWNEHAQEVADEVFAEAEEIAAEYGVELSTAVEVGEAWRRIVDYVEAHDIDHVVMGSHGRDDDSPLPLGSVAETVMRRSPVLVSIVR